RFIESLAAVAAILWCNVSKARCESIGGRSLSRQNQQDFRPVRFMKIEPKPSDREVLAGLVERVTYQNAESGFCVVRVRVRGGRELVTLVGHAAAIAAGVSVVVSVTTTYRVASFSHEIPHPSDLSM